MTREGSRYPQFSPSELRSHLENYSLFFHPTLAAPRNGSVLLELSGAYEGRWLLRFESGRLQVLEPGSVAPDASIMASAQDWWDLMMGALDIGRAVKEGRVQYTGDRDLLMYFAKTVPTWDDRRRIRR